MLAEAEVEDITVKIESGRLTPPFNTNREHVKHVKTIVAKKENHQKYPRCGSEMVIREVKKGRNVGNKFWGCSKFPKCRGVVSATEPGAPVNCTKHHSCHLRVVRVSELGRYVSCVQALGF